MFLMRGVESKEKQGIESKQSKRLNVIGLLNRKNQLESYIFESKITSEIVIKFLDLYVQKIDKLTVVVLDNALLQFILAKLFRKRLPNGASRKWKYFGCQLILHN